MAKNVSNKRDKKNKPRKTQKQKQRQKQVVNVNVSIDKRTKSSNVSRKKEPSAISYPIAHMGVTYVAPQNLDLLNNMVTRDEIAKTMENTFKESMREQKAFYEKEHRNALKELRMTQRFTRPVEMTAESYFNEEQTRPRIIPPSRVSVEAPKENKADRLKMWLSEGEQKREREEKKLKEERLGGKEKISRLI